MTKLPQSFLSRIAEYPGPVREILSQELNRDLVIKHLSVLHGDKAVDEARIAGLLQRPVLVDAFLTRLLQSARFTERLRTFLAALIAPDDPVTTKLVAREAVALVAPVAAPDSPYFYKLREIARAGQDSEAARTAGQDAKRLLALAELCRLLGTGSLQCALAKAMLEVAEGADAEPLAALLEACGLPRELKILLPDTTEMPGPDPVLTAFARVRIEMQRLPALGRLHVETLQRMIGEEFEVALAAPVPLLLEPQTPLIDPAAELWSVQVAQGFLTGILKQGATCPEDHGRLSLLGDIEISPLLVVWLRCGGLGSVQSACLLGARRDDGLSWVAEIADYEAEDEPEEIGQVALPGGPQAEGPELVIEFRNARQYGEVTARDVPPGEAYALILRLDAEAHPEAWLNFDCCHVIEGHGREAFVALAEAVRSGKFDHAVMRKPVVLAGRNSPRHPSYLIRAVQGHWAYGGSYMSTGLSVDFHAATGRFTLGTRNDEHLTRMLMAEAAVLPLSALATMVGQDPLPAPLTWLDLGLILLREGVAVCHAGRTDVQLDEAALLKLARPLAPDRVDDRLREGAMAAAPPSRRLAETLSPARHWPVEHLLSRITDHHRWIEAQAEIFVQTPTLPAAVTQIAALSAPETELRSVIGAADSFALALAGTPGLLAQLSEGQAVAFLEIARFCPSVDQIAAQLTLQAPEIVGDRQDVVVPLIELLALGLDAVALETAWSALAERALRDGANKRMRYRIAASGQRYVGASSLARAAYSMACALPEALHDPKLLRHFTPLLGHPGLKLVERLSGGSLADEIALAADFRELFRDAVIQGDRPVLQAFLANTARIRQVDFDSWMDVLRAHSNELRALALPVAGSVPSGGGVQRRKLMAAIFADSTELEALEEAGFLGDGSELSAICRNQLGWNADLNMLLSRRFEASAMVPLQIVGRSVAEVFANAATACRTAADPTSTGRVSVIVSAYDPDPELLSASLASLRAQSHRDVEIFLVDDASGPEGRAAIDAAQATDPDIRLIRMERNSGPYAGRNRALDLATGEFVAIQDADDWSHPARFARQIAALRAVPALQLVTTPHIRIDTAGLVQMEAGFSIFGDGPMSSMFRREAFEEIGGFAAVRSRGDVEMRERIRAYFGGHALRELKVPLMLCFAASTTLSQQVRRGQKEALQLFRTHIDRRPDLGTLRRDGIRFDPGEVIVPKPLRPEAGT